MCFGRPHPGRRAELLYYQHEVETESSAGPTMPSSRFSNQLNTGPHEADFIMMRAPSPVLLMCATHDFFDVGGTWDSFATPNDCSRRMGFAERGQHQ